MRKLNDGFTVELYRQRLASSKKLLKLKSLYVKRIPEIKNKNTQNFWDKRILSDVAYVPYDGMTKERVEIAYKFLPKAAKKILDIGAGYGYVERLLSKNGDMQIYGNDISRNAIENLKKRFKGEFKVESIYRMSYSKGFFDAIFLLEVLEHVPPSKTFKVLKNIKNILKENGYLILSVPTNEGLENLPENWSGHVRMYTIELIKAELKLGGFEVLEIKTLFAFPNLYKFKKLLSKIFVKRWEPNDIIILAKSI